jgi:tetratricopeptide (TPR) repeat protein
LWKDEKALGELLKARPADLSPQMLLLVARLLPWDTPQREAWLRQAQARFPADFWLNDELAGALLKRDPAEATGLIRAALAVRPDFGYPHVQLGHALEQQHKLPEAIAEYHRAIELDPAHARRAYNNLGIVLLRQDRTAEAIAATQKALELAPYAGGYLNLGNALDQEQRFREAVAAFEKAIKLAPDYAAAYAGLGAVLSNQGKLPEAIAACQKAIELDPKDGHAYGNLGLARKQQKKLPEAVAAYRKALDVDPRNPAAHGNLGVALLEQGKLQQALAAFRKVIDLDPLNAVGYSNLGEALRLQKKLPEAVAACRKAIELNPKFVQAYINLAIVLGQQKKPAEVLATVRKAIAANPKDAQAYNVLGNVLKDQHKLPEAIAAYEKAIAVNPQAAFPAYINLTNSGAYEAAAGAARQALPLFAEGDPRRATLLRVVTYCDKMHALETRLPALAEGKEAAGADELLALAKASQHFRRRYPTAARLYEKAFAGKRSLAEDWAKHHRYNAACAAARGAAGDGDEAAALSAAEKSRLRQTAHAWLTAELGLVRKKLNDGPPPLVLETEELLAFWQGDGDFAAVREAAALDALPRAEREPWQALWADIAGLLAAAPKRYTETRREGTLTDREKSRAHPWPMTAGRTYVIDLESDAFDAYLKVTDVADKLLAENDDISPGNQNARLVFTPKETGVYRLMATSFEEAGTGAYTLRVREFAAR